jgi:hypothetical protein
MSFFFFLEGRKFAYQTVSRYDFGTRAFLTAAYSGRHGMPALSLILQSNYVDSYSIIAPAILICTTCLLSKVPKHTYPSLPSLQVSSKDLPPRIMPAHCSWLPYYCLDLYPSSAQSRMCPPALGTQVISPGSNRLFHFQAGTCSLSNRFIVRFWPGNHRTAQAQTWIWGVESWRNPTSAALRRMDLRFHSTNLLSIKASS